MKSNVYIVTSPTQVMSALDAKQYNSGKDFLIVKCGNRDRVENNKQILNLVNSTFWDKIFWIHSSSNKYLNHALIFYYMLKFQFKFNRTKTIVYIGEYRSFFFAYLQK